MAFLFDYHVSYQSDCKNRTELPFQVFGMSQQGMGHKSISLGNQDAASVYIGKKLLIGAVADGCSQGTNINAFSYNQVGANIACNLIVKVTRRLVQRKRLDINQFTQEFEKNLLLQYKRLFNGFSPWKNEKKMLLKNLFSATFIAFVITDKQYVVFYYGDGHIHVNGQQHILKTDVDSYFTNRLTSIGQMHDSIKFLKIGSTSKLKNILINTDGFLDEDLLDSKVIKRFFFNKSPIIHQQGFVDKKEDFRFNVVKHILKNNTHSAWPHDDATFLFLKRINNF